MKPFYMTKMSRQKFKYPQNEKRFQGEIKSIFHHFSRLSVAKNCLIPEGARLRRPTINKKVIMDYQNF